MGWVRRVLVQSFWWQPASETEVRLIGRAGSRCHRLARSTIPAPPALPNCTRLASQHRIRYTEAPQRHVTSKRSQKPHTLSPPSAQHSATSSPPPRFHSVWLTDGAFQGGEHDAGVGHDSAEGHYALIPSLRGSSKSSRRISRKKGLLFRRSLSATACQHTGTTAG